MKKLLYTAAAAALLLGSQSCERYLDITPTGVVIPSTVSDYRALLTKAYSVYPQHKARVDFRSDEVFLNTASSSASYVKDIYTWNDTNPDPSTDPYQYGDFYNSVFYVNHIIQNAPADLVDGTEKNQILGEAYALRALNYFELSNMYADVYNGTNGSAPDVPLLTAPQLEGDFPKSTLDAVYTQIFSDLDRAESLVSTAVFDPGLNYRFSIPAIHALRARVYQYRGEWAKAAAEVDKVLAYNSSLEDFNSFKVLPCSYKSVESIMNLDFNVNSNLNTLSRASDQLIALYDQKNDLRFAKYFKKNGSRYQTAKYSSANEFKCTFRVGELKLIKAEALAKLGKEAESKAELLALAQKRYNTVGLAAFTAKINGLSGDGYYAELLNERIRETNYEGLRWFDMRRTTKPATVHNLDGTPYQLNQSDPRYTLPYPKDARLRNPSL